MAQLLGEFSLYGVTASASSRIVDEPGLGFAVNEGISM